MLKRWIFFLLLIVLLVFPASALAQGYYFSLPQFEVHAFWNDDGTLSVDYTYHFQNDPQGHPIEYVDVPMPNDYFDENSVYADVNGNPVTDISRSGYQGSGSGVAVGLGQYTIPPGGSGTVHVFIGTIERKIEQDTSGDNYVSAVFGPSYFDSSIVYGTTDMTVTFHLPPGIEPDQPRWHQAPAGWPPEPETGFDENGRITYTWRNTRARPDVNYNFGASFPLEFVPESAVYRPSPFATFIQDFDISCLIPFLCFGFFAFIVLASLLGEKNRKLKYLPPKIAIEGHGIKRGLTAVEAAILLEQPVDKVMTMVLFSVIKKNAARVVSREPLKLEILDPQPEDLRPYETDFLEAFKLDNAKRQRALEAMMVSLIKGVAQKMKGFSARETTAYYKDIMTRAWAQVEAADTPEVKSQKFDEVMEWTMLDRDFNDRTRDVFRTGPVILPHWWGRYDPGYGRSGPVTTPSTTSAPSAGQPGGGGVSMPNLPGGEFAASMVGGIQSFSSKVVGNISDFTGRITQQTNPPPPPTTTSSRGGGGGRSGGCACACACAGCACACAGGGR